MVKEIAPKIKRVFEGEVVSDKGEKTIIVKIDKVRIHKKYHKRYMVSRNYAVHDPKKEYKIGEVVRFEECRPLSKTKRWRVLSKVK
ncbi:MAG: 30S ribosomal protein S17 [Patescibacteria group bacterium]|nr:30S ribosomal protein S17 [Patescibacteria group bacterium]MDD5490200.1 30S ribosomal protein S17 [Patescibacteria group bacterium]